MLIKDMSKKEIEKFLESRGDYVKLDYLTRFLKQEPNIDIKKFIYLKLAEINEKIGMLGESAKNYGSAASISITFSDKMKYYVKEAEMYIKSGNFEKVEAAMKKAMNEANSIEKREIYLTIKDIYKKQAENLMIKNKIVHAGKVYEKLLGMKISDSEKEEFKEKLSEVKSKIGGRKIDFGLSI